MSVRLLKSGDPVNWANLLEITGADPGSLARLRMRDRIAVILLGELPSPAASILKQCMLSGGADALVHREVLTCRVESSRAGVYGTPSTILRGCDSLTGQPFSLGETGAEIRKLLLGEQLPDFLDIGGVRLTYGGRPLIMGILNITPDSFSDGGSYASPEEAASKAIRMAKEGASIIDVGGESTRPGSLAVSARVQTARVVPVIETIRKTSSVPVSIDTCLPRVASAAVSAGASMINSVNGMETPGMAETAAELGVPVCVMHMRGTPVTMQENPGYGDASLEIGNYLLDRVDALTGTGVKKENILVDPGIGFGKRLEDNLELLRSLEWLKVHTGCRVLLGHSRKSFLGSISGIEDPVERDSLTHVVSVLQRGADIVRVHDVPGTEASFRLAEKMGVFQ